MAVKPGKRQIAKLTKKQLGFEIGRNVLNQIASIANAVRDIFDKGIDPATRQPLKCSPDDIKRSLSTEQLAAVEDFMSNWCIDPEPQPTAPAPSAPARKRK